MTVHGVPDPGPGSAIEPSPGAPVDSTRQAPSAVADGETGASAGETRAPAGAAQPATVVPPTNGPPAGPSTEAPTTATPSAPTERGPSLRRRLGWRWAARGVLLAAVAVTVMVIALAIGMRANDAAIDEHLGSATATVLSVSPLRTGIEFVDVTGATVRPEGGVLYPGLLSLGQQFVVEYSTQDPQIARVAGRTASVGTLLLVLVTVTTWLVAVPLTWWCRRRSRLPLFGSRRAARAA